MPRALSPRFLVLVILVVVFFAFSFGPTMRNISSTSELEKQEAELKKQQGITLSLRREAEEADSLDYLEQEARRQRLVRPGETLYLVTPEDQDDEVTYRTSPFRSIDEAWESVMHRINGGRE